MLKKTMFSMPLILIGIGIKELSEFNILSLTPIYIGVSLIMADVIQVAWEKKPKIKEPQNARKSKNR